MFMKRILTQPVLKNDQERATFVRRFGMMSHSLKECQGLKLYNEKDRIVWINPKPKAGSKNLNFYCFNERDYGDLNQLLNTITQKENEMKEKGYDLSGVKSFNRNVWLDLSKESNAIEGIFQDFSQDLLDFRTQLRGQIAVDPPTENFEKYDYFKKLLNQYYELKENNDTCVKLKGKKVEHIFNMDTIRHFIAFKYAYKCAKKDRRKKLTRSDVSEVISNTSALLSGNLFVPFRSIQVYILDGTANWVPANPKAINEKLDALADWFVDDNQSGRLHPIEKAAIFHAEFIRIHPFMDGNGRTGRILANYSLIRDEMPTVSIKHKNTKQYFDALNKAIESHEIDDLVEMFYKEVYNSASLIDDCLNQIEKTQKPREKEAVK